MVALMENDKKSREFKRRDPEVSDETLAVLGLKDYSIPSFQMKAYELMDLTSLYRLRYVADKHFAKDTKSRESVLRIVDQRIDSL